MKYHFYEMPAKKTRTLTYTSRSNRVSDRLNKKSPVKLPRKRSKPSEESDGHTTKKAKDSFDKYCWKCHKLCEGVSAHRCSACIRVYHGRCLTRANQFSEDNRCSACTEQERSKQEALPLFRSGRLSELLWEVVETSFVSEKQGMDKLMAWDSDDDKLACIVDFRYIRDRVRVAELKYRSPAELLDDVKWLYHNCVIVDGESSATTKAAKEILGNFTNELKFMSDCTICYERKKDDPDFFSKPCVAHHLLVWFKWKFGSYWPAKLYKVVDKKAYIRFFHTLQHSTIPLNDCYFMSSECPIKNTCRQSKDLKLALEQKDEYLKEFKIKYKKEYPFQPMGTRYVQEKEVEIIKSIKEMQNPANTDGIDVKPFAARNESNNEIVQVNHSYPNTMLETETENCNPNTEDDPLPIITSVQTASENPSDDVTTTPSLEEDDDSDIEIIDINPVPSRARNTLSYQDEVTIMQNYMKEDKKIAHLAFNAACFLVVPVFNQIFPIVKQLGQGNLSNLRKDIRRLKEQISHAEETAKRNSATIINAGSVVDGTMAVKENIEQRVASAETLQEDLSKQNKQLEKLLESCRAANAANKNKNIPSQPKEGTSTEGMNTVITSVTTKTVTVQKLEVQQLQVSSSETTSTTTSPSH